MDVMGFECKCGMDLQHFVAKRFHTMQAVSKLDQFSTESIHEASPQRARSTTTVLLSTLLAT